MLLSIDELLSSAGYFLEQLGDLITKTDFSCNTDPTCNTDSTTKTDSTCNADIIVKDDLTCNPNLTKKIEMLHDNINCESRRYDPVRDEYINQPDVNPNLNPNPNINPNPNPNINPNPGNAPGGTNTPPIARGSSSLLPIEISPTTGGGSSAGSEIQLDIPLRKLLKIRSEVAAGTSSLTNPEGLGLNQSYASMGQYTEFTTEDLKSMGQRLVKSHPNNYTIKIPNDGSEPWTMRNSYYRSDEEINSRVRSLDSTMAEDRQRWEIRPDMETIKNLYQSSCEKKWGMKDPYSILEKNKP